MNSLCTEYKSLKYIFFIGFSFIYLSSCQTTSDEGLDYVNREDILENIEIYESSKNVQTSTITAEGKQNKVINIKRSFWNLIFEAYSINYCNNVLIFVV